MAQNFLIEYASGESSTTTGKTFPVDGGGNRTLASWIQCIGPGTVVAVCEGGTVFTKHATGGEVYKSSFTALTSTTCTYVVMGNGAAPPAIPVGTGAATTAVAGTAALSVAPAVASAPIAVGTNDPRVCTVDVMIDFAAADGVFVESTVWIPGVVGTITGATLSVNASVTQSDTNYLTYTLGIRDGAGGGASTVASQTTKTTGGGAFVAFTALTLGAITNATTAAISQVTFKSAKTGTGQAATGQGMLRITYTVP